MSGYGQPRMMTEEERIAAALKKLNKGKFDAPGASNAGMKIAKRDPYSQAMLVDSMERAGATQFETPSVNSLMDAEKSRRSSQIDALIGPSNAAEIAAGERGVNSARKLAAAMRGKPLNQGKSVGPSGIYVGPNWGETIENLTNQLGSGYMDYQANKADAVLDPLRKQDSDTGISNQRAALQLAIDEKNRDFDLAETTALAKMAPKLSIRSMQHVETGDFNSVLVNDDTGQMFLGGEPLSPKEASKFVDDNTTTDKNPSASEATNIFRNDYFQTSVKDLTGLLDNGFDPSTVGGALNVAATGNSLTNVVASEEAQQWSSAVDGVISSVTATLSGATVRNDEIDRKLDSLIPRYGDSPETIKAKINTLNSIGSALSRLAGEGPIPEGSDLEREATAFLNSEVFRTTREINENNEKNSRSTKTDSEIAAIARTLDVSPGDIVVIDGEKIKIGENNRPMRRKGGGS